jgi:tRNA pseudouridine55 synthase
MKRTKGLPINGWVVLDKPEGLSSTQAMAKVRRALNANKAGHGGTLDPFATGVLAIALGEATKLVNYVLDGTKTYQFEIAWGEARDTDDITGKTIRTSDKRPSAEDIKNILPRFIGAIQQIPPQFSALHIDGERAYDIARRGETMELEARSITIYDLKYVGSEGTNSASFEVSCSKGTYIRSLARDMGEALGCFGYVKALKRLRTGPFQLTQAISLAKLEEMGQKDAGPEGFRACVYPLAAVLDDIPAVTVNEMETRRLRQGQGIVLHPLRLTEALTQSPIIAVKDDCDLVALASLEANVLKPVRVFHRNNDFI